MFNLPGTSTAPLQQEANSIYGLINFQFLQLQNVYNQISTTIYNNDLGFTPEQVFSTLDINGAGVVLWMSTLATAIGTVTGFTPPAIPSTAQLGFGSTGIITFQPTVSTSTGGLGPG